MIVGEVFAVLCDIWVHQEPISRSFKIAIICYLKIAIRRYLSHSLIIIREILILTLSIFNAL